MKIPNWIIFGFIIVSFLGLMDAGYLTVQHYTGAQLNCGLTGGCEEVTTSKYSTVFGVPVALGGVFYYASVLFLSLLYFDTKKKKILKIIQPLTIIGLLASAWFVFLQFFVIKAICQYCMASAITSTLLFILGLFLLKYKKHLT